MYLRFQVLEQIRTVLAKRLGFLAIPRGFFVFRVYLMFVKRVP